MPLAYKEYLEGRGYLAPYEADRDIDLAIGLLDSAVRHDPSYAMAHIGLGEAYFEKYSDTKEPELAEFAIEQCDKAIELDDEIASAHALLGRIYQAKGEQEKAIDAFARALELSPLSFGLQEATGDAYRELEEYDRAEVAYNEALLLRPPGEASTYYRLGYMYARWQQRYDDAIAPFKVYIDLEPEKSRGYNSLGVVYFELNRFEDARRMFEHSLATWDTTYLVCNNLATCYYWEGRFADASRLFEKALEFDPSNYELNAHLAEAYYWDPDQSDKASSVFHTAIELAEPGLEDNPNNAGLIADLAGYYFKIGDRAKAESLLVRVVALNPTEDTVMLHIAETYEDLGKRDLALLWIERALDEGLPLIKLKRNVGLRSLRTDERFEELFGRYEGAI